MNPLREWLEAELVSSECNLSKTINKGDAYQVATYCIGFNHCLRRVIHEIKTREDAERERVDENTIALDQHAADVLKEKEGGSE